MLDKIRTIDDYKREEEEFQLRKLKATADAKGGGNSPAALQLANEYQKARAAGDTQRMNDISLFAKTMDKGVVINANGTAQTMDGYGAALGSNQYDKQLGGNMADLETAAPIATAKSDAGNISDLTYKPQIAEATDAAKAKSEKTTELGERVSTIPQLEKTVEDLNKLGKKATYTSSGRAADWFVRETAPLRGKFIDNPTVATDGAIARGEYTSLIDNQVLPLLKQTFGGSFTVQEGANLKATMGDPNLSPPEKEAVLRSFINQKKQTINSKERELGVPETVWDASSAPTPNGETFTETPMSQLPPVIQGKGNISVKPTLNTIAPNDPRIAAARAAGYSEDDIVSYLGGR